MDHVMLIGIGYVGMNLQFESREGSKNVYTCIYIYACCLLCLLHEKAWEKQQF